MKNISECIGEGPKVGKRRDQDGLKRNKHGEKKRKNGKQGAG